MASSCRRRHAFGVARLLMATAIVAFCGCAAHVSGPAVSQPHGTDSVFVSRDYGFRLPYPATLDLHQGFRASYLANDDWKTYAGPNAMGQAVASLVLPASNAVTSAELRIGVSQDATALRDCKQLPAAALADSEQQVRIDGVVFTTFRARDAGMSHYLLVQAYRTIHDSRCYAIDVLVYGTNPQVYEPPRTPPFTRRQAFERLLPVVKNLQFFEPATAM